MADTVSEGVTNTNNNQNVVIDGVTYKLDDLSQDARALLGFLARLDREIAEARFALDRNMMARRGATEQLKTLLPSK
ncbi:MAG: hypothetical protein ACPGJH_00450 [Alphaproteobacteria bacterium]